MERCSEQDFELQSNWLEHSHRYLLASQLSTGKVVDCACGIGYGSQILFNSNVSSYNGFDPSEDAISSACAKNAQKENISFQVAKLEELPLLNSSVDTFVSLETLEHLINPEQGIREARRVLKKDGIFIGSVPTKKLEEMAKSIYGPNEFHLHSFDAFYLNALLGKYFNFVKIYIASFTIGTLFTPLESNLDTEISLLGNTNKLSQLGSYFFVCGDQQSVEAALKNSKLSHSVYLPGIEKILTDSEERMPLLRLAEERWELMCQSYSKITEMQAYIDKLHMSLPFKIYQKMKSYINKIKNQK